jgi:HAD superfamily hydrolase (TIGR01549 family)
MSKKIIPSGVKVISFDLDDTLWNGTQVIMHAEKVMLDWMQEHTPRVSETLSQQELRDRKMQFIQSNPHLVNKISDARRLFLEELFSELGYSSSVDLAKACFIEFHEARQQVVLFDHVLQTLADLKQNYRLIAITNGNADIEKTGLSHAFEFCLQAEKFDRPKPFPDIFEHALERTNCYAAQVLHVGDHPVQDMQGAHEIGMKTAWLNDGTRQWQQEFQPNVAIKHIRELL